MENKPIARASTAMPVLRLTSLKEAVVSIMSSLHFKQYSKPPLH